MRRLVIEGYLAPGASRSLAEAMHAVDAEGGKLSLERVPLPWPGEVGTPARNEWRVSSTHREVAVFVVEALKRLIQ